MKHKPANISSKTWDELDSPPIPDSMFARMRPVGESHPEILRRVRGVQQSPAKIPVSILLSPKVVEYFKSTGRGWQTRMNEILCEYVESHARV